MVNEIDTFNDPILLKIKNSAPTTHFIAVGFFPGGYSGIQQHDNDDKNFVYGLYDAQLFISMSNPMKFKF